MTACKFIFSGPFAEIMDRNEFTRACACAYSIDDCDGDSVFSFAKIQIHYFAVAEFDELA